jgi:hypothetical protein
VFKLNVAGLTATDVMLVVVVDLWTENLALAVRVGLETEATDKRWSPSVVGAV